MFQSKTLRFEPWRLEFADPVSGGAQTFAVPTHPMPDRAPLIDPTWSNDDESIAFYEHWVGGRGIVLKPAAGGNETPLLPEKDIRPSWSPTAGEIAYWEYGDAGRLTLKATTFPGRTTRTLAGPFDPGVDMPLAGPEPPAWSADGKRIAFSFRRGIVTVPVAGGPLLPLVAQGPQAYAHEPSFAPDGRHFAYIKSLLDQFGSNASWQLIVRDLRSGQERIVATGPGNTQAHGPQSWSPDSTQVAFAESRTITVTPLAQEGTVYIARRDGTGGPRVLARRWLVGAPAWGGSPLPSYYIKHVEVAQAIAPELSPITDIDPLAEDPYKLTWKLRAKNGFTMPLVGGKPTLIRIYVGDASLRPGRTARRSLSFRVEVSTMFGVLEGKASTIVTAADVEPRQTAKDGSLNAVLPAVSARSGTAVRIEVKVNDAQQAKECEGCHPNGNEAHLDDVRFRLGGALTLVPVPITIVDRFSTPPKRHPPSSAYSHVLGPVLRPLVPAPDERIVLSDSPGSIEWDPLIVPTSRIGSIFALLELLDRLSIFQLTDSWIHGPRGSGVTKWVGYASPPSGGWGGIASSIGGDLFVVTGPLYNDVAHELGHTLGLWHRQGLKSTTPLGLPLPYQGIGGVGYAYDEGVDVGQIDQIFTSENTGDLMSYDSRTWTSPLTWEHMFETIRTVAGLPLRSQPSSPLNDPMSTLREVEPPPAKTRRLVSGAITKTAAVIFDSTVVKTVAPETAGPRAGRIVALDSTGRTVAAAPVRGAPYVLEDGASALPFVVALPADASIASLVLRSPTGEVLAERHRSATPPIGRFLELPAQVAARSSLKVHWVATDTDGNRLSVMLFARRGERPWQPVAMGRPRSSAVVRPRSLGSSGPLQLRLVINDRFRTVRVDSGFIRVG